MESDTDTLAEWLRRLADEIERRRIKPSSYRGGIWVGQIEQPLTPEQIRTYMPDGRRHLDLYWEYADA